jgi:hypothetical protein
VLTLFPAIITYQTMHQRLMAMVARTYAMDATRHQLLKRWAERSDENMAEACTERERGEGVDSMG